MQARTRIRNGKLRQRRLELTWSQRRAAREISRHCEEPLRLHVDTYAGWERGEHAPSLAYVPGLLKALGVNQLENLGYILDGDHGRVLLHPDADQTSSSASSEATEASLAATQGDAGASAEGSYAASTGDEPAASDASCLTREGITDRKQFLRSSSLLLGTLAADRAGVPRLLQQLEQSNVGAITLTELENAAERFALTYEHTPPAIALPQIRDNLGFVTELLSGWQSLADRTRLYVLAARLSLLAGHAETDLGDLPASRIHYSTAARLAHDLDHPELRIWALGGQAAVALAEGHPEQALHLTGLAIQGDTESSARVKALARHATALAHLGEAGGVEPTLEQAREIVREPQREPASGVFAFDAFALERYVGACHLILNQPERAAAPLTRALDLYAGTPPQNQSPINHAGAHVLHATVLARTGEPEHACEAATRLLDLDQRQVVAPLRPNVERLTGALKPYTTLPHVRAFSEALTEHTLRLPA